MQSGPNSDLIVDASVAVKWFFDEADSGEARTLLRGTRRLHAPDLISLEVCGALLRSFREKKMSDSAVRQAIIFWDRLIAIRVVRLVPNDLLFPQARELSLQIRHALADCLYLAAAQSMHAELVTADEPMHKRGQAVHDRITLLGGVQSQ